MRLFLLPFLKLHATYSPVRFFSGSELFLHLFLCWRREMTASIFDTCVREGEWQPLQSSLLCWEVKVTTSCVGEEKRPPLYSTPMRGSDYLYGHHFLVDEGSASLFFATPVWETGEWQPLNKAQNAPGHIPVHDPSWRWVHFSPVILHTVLGRLQVDPVHTYEAVLYVALCLCRTWHLYYAFQRPKIPIIIITAG